MEKFDSHSSRLSPPGRRGKNKIYSRKKKRSLSSGPGGGEGLFPTCAMLEGIRLCKTISRHRKGGEIRNFHSLPLGCFLLTCPGPLAPGREEVQLGPSSWFT